MNKNKDGRGCKIELIKQRLAGASFVALAVVAVNLSLPTKKRGDTNIY